MPSNTISAAHKVLKDSKGKQMVSNFIPLLVCRLLEALGGLLWNLKGERFNLL